MNEKGEHRVEKMILSYLYAYAAMFFQQKSLISLKLVTLTLYLKISQQSAFTKPKFRKYTLQKFIICARYYFTGCISCNVQ